MHAAAVQEHMQQVPVPAAQGSPSFTHFPRDSRMKGLRASAEWHYRCLSLRLVSKRDMNCSVCLVLVLQMQEIDHVGVMA